MTTTIKQNKIIWECNQRQAIDKWRVVEWARKILERPDVLYLDTETTGLGRAYLVEIAVLSRHGSSRFNTLVKPPVPCESGAERVHGITKEMLADAPLFPDIYPRLQEILNDRHIVIYNASFDTGILNNCCDYYKLPPLKFTTSCAMNRYAAYFGEWSDYWGNYKWQKLPSGSHRAAGDAWACRELVKRMALAPSCQVNYERMFPPVQLFCKWNRVAQLTLEWNKSDRDYYYKRQRCFSIKLPSFYLKNSTTHAKKEIDDDDIPW